MSLIPWGGLQASAITTGAQKPSETQITADGTALKSTEYLYEPDTFRPMAQVETNHQTDRERLHYIVTDHAGTPQELCSPTGEIEWRGDQALWGNYYQRTTKVNRGYMEEAANDVIHCDLRYQGQLEDTESGLYYNLNRYYDADSGQYLSPDPIGMAGGIRPQGYVDNPVGQVDPYGLVLLYRGMNIDEYNNLIKKQTWEYGNGSMEGKWFAEFYNDAVTWGHQMGHGGDTFRVVQVDVPDEIADNFFKVEKLDNIGPARYAELEDLNAVNALNEPKVKVKWSREIKAKPKACK